MQDYKKLKVWEKSHSLTLQIYQVTLTYPKYEMFGIVSQIRRAATSISANIAEGSSSSSNLNFKRFINIALGSSHEVEYYLILSRDLKYVDLEIFEKLYNIINEVKAMLISLSNKIIATV